MSEGEHPWQQVNRNLAEMKIGEAGDELVDSFRKRLVATARAAAEAGQDRISADTISSLIRSVDPLLEIAYRVYREVWNLQGKKESPEFVKTLYEYMIVPRIVRHMGWVRSELGGAIDPMYPHGEPSRSLLEDTEVEAEKCRREWERICEIDAMEIGYIGISRTTQPDLGSESPVEGGSMEHLSMRPGRKPDESVRRRREIVSNGIRSQADFRDNGKVKELFSALDAAGVPLPERRRGPGGWRPDSWIGLLEKANSAETKRMIDHLRRDRFPKKKNGSKGTM